MPHKNLEVKKEYHKRYGKEYRQSGKTNKENIKLYTRAWRKNNPEKKYLSGIKSRAKRSGMEFNLSEQDIIFPKICPILHIPLEITEGRQTDRTPAADRVNNARGYTKDNVRFISHKANRMKSDMTIEQVERLLAYMKGEL